MSSDDLAAAVHDATNAAIEQNLAALRSGGTGVADLTRLGEELDTIGRNSARALDESARGMREAISAVEWVSELHRGRSSVRWDR